MAGNRRNRRVQISALSPDAQRQIKEQLGTLQPKQGRIKVSTKEKRTSDGIVFASMWECRVYMALKLFIGREQFTLQPSYDIIEAYEDPSGKRHRGTKYKADFLIEGEHVIDAKGHMTGVFRIKEKLFVKKYGKPLHLWKDQGNQNKNLGYIRNKLITLGAKLKK